MTWRRLGWLLGGLILAMGGVGRAGRAARGTALRGAVAWMRAAWVLGGIAQLVAMREPWESGRPVAGHWAYLATLAALAGVISVLNARRPGGRAWALLMGVLVL